MQTNPVDTTNSRPLADIRVVEMGQLLAGPFCGQLFADFGADVIKLEPPGVGDPMREWGRERPKGESLWWAVCARNKKSVTVDLRVEEGQELARQLIAEADVLLENFRPGTLERWNLAPEDLMKINPKLIIARVSGFGQTGPYSRRPGYGSIGEAMGGLRYVTGTPDAPPSRVGISIGDSLAAMFATIGTLTALHEREKSGRGQVVDVAIYEAVLAIMESLVPEYVLAGHQRERTGSILPNVAPSNVYPTADGDMVLIAANQNSVFKRLSEAMQRPELATDPRYIDHTGRGEHQEELDNLIAEWTATIPTRELLDLMEEHAVPTGLIYRAKDMLEDPHFQAREAIVPVPHPVLGEVPVQNVTPKLSRTPGDISWLGPALGQHTEEILSKLLGLSADRIAELQSSKVI